MPPGLDSADDLAADGEPEGARPHPEVIIRILGVPSVDGHPSLGRIDLNLITFLACSGGHGEWSQHRIRPRVLRVYGR